MNKSKYNSLNREEKVQFLKEYRFDNANARDSVSFLVRMISMKCGNLNKIINCEQAAEKLLVEGIVAFFIMKEESFKTYIEVSPTSVTTFSFNGKDYYLDMNTMGKFVYKDSTMVVSNRDNIIILLYNGYEDAGGFSFLDEMYTGKLNKKDLMNKSIIEKVVNILVLVDKNMTRTRKIKKLFE